ncbi:MAG: hypothetical protein ACQEQX_01795 [Thermodesulfobacteriota bacterium]
MGLKDHFQQEKPWAILGWTRKQWKRSKMWKKAGVSEEKMARLVQSLDHETIQNLKDHAQAEVLVDKIFGESLAVDSD